MSKGTTNRRNLLGLGAGLVAIAAGWQTWLGRERPISFQTIDGLPGWRRITFASVTGTNGSATDSVFLGLENTNSPPPFSSDALCKTLYPKAAKGIPAAIFTDVNCPNCTRLEAKLNARSNALALNWHDLPLLGPTSERAARAMVAGDQQPGGDAFRQTILRTSPGRLQPAKIQKLAEQAGLNAQRLIKDMNGAQVSATLLASRRAAATLGVWGTPGFTIGRTFVLGDMPENTLDQLIELEAETRSC